MKSVGFFDFCESSPTGLRTIACHENDAHKLNRKVISLKLNGEILRLKFHGGCYSYNGFICGLRRSYDGFVSPSELEALHFYGRR